jgi:peroxiredoxin
MVPKKPASPSALRRNFFVSMIAAGFLLVAAGVMPWIADTKKALPTDAVPLFPPARVQFPVPQLTLTDLRGMRTSLNDYRGRVVLINNWATWCPPCRAEMPELQAYYAAHSKGSFVLIAIESGDPASQVADFVHQYGLTFPIWLDPGLTAVAIFNYWGLPSSYLIDPDGTIQLAWLGQVNRPTLEKYVTPLLEK